MDDTIELENAVFTSLPNPGTLAAGSFRSGSGAGSALDADDYLIHDSSSGALYDDASGNAGVGPVQIATLSVAVINKNLSQALNRRLAMLSPQCGLMAERGETASSSRAGDRGPGATGT